MRGKPMSESVFGDIYRAFLEYGIASTGERLDAKERS
jgi:hypothetical protein